jgi:hypothetical protein
MRATRMKERFTISNVCRISLWLQQSVARNKNLVSKKKEKEWLCAIGGVTDLRNGLTVEKPTCYSSTSTGDHAPLSTLFFKCIGLCSACRQVKSERFMSRTTHVVTYNIDRLSSMSYADSSARIRDRTRSRTDTLSATQTRARTSLHKPLLRLKLQTLRQARSTSRSHTRT